MKCEHVDYDDYFEVCNDCGKTVKEIHLTECGANVEVDEEGYCTRCGYVVAA